ncbi:MAG: hypothetical protein HDT07_01745 [Bacteroidales bacterium]|nr:hypothetical protein [Bacteroidales bacterium]
MQDATFQLDSYHFKKASINFNIPEKATLNIDFRPSGKLLTKKSEYVLTFQVLVNCKETASIVVDAVCEATFKFSSPIEKDDLPDYFYPNSLAIVYPYVRAFVSTITLQANIRPIVLPTINMLGFQSQLQENTTVE